MKLVDVYEHPFAAGYLFELLKERSPEQSISHKKMPTIREHISFFSSLPYEAWYLITSDDAAEVFGSIYLTKSAGPSRAGDEIGIAIFKAHQRKGIGRKAVGMLMALHPRDRFLANINPANFESIEFFESLGFKHIQNTYAVDMPSEGNADRCGTVGEPSRVAGKSEEAG